MKKINAILMASMMTASMLGATACGDKKPDNVTADKYSITVACQTEMGEEEVLKVLKKAYEAKYPDREIIVKTFSGEGFEQYMLGIASDKGSSPNIIWTCDTLHSQWDQYFIDLRPYYEQSAETDYSLFYETMLDAASTNGYFKPTKNYTGSFRSDDLDANSDGKESNKNYSPYGLYYAPRDYNKPAILCNTHLFAELDKEYEMVYKKVAGVAEMPADYVTTSARLAAIVAGNDWDEMTDLYAFARMIAERMVYIINNEKDDRDIPTKWSQRAALNLFVEWEPTYTTLMNDMGVDLIGDDGSLNIAPVEKFKALHDGLFPQDNEEVAGVMTTTNDGISFSSGKLFMTVCSRPVVLGYGDTFRQVYGDTHLETIQFPVKDIAAGNSGYAISRVWEGKGVTVNGVYKSYSEISWDFIKYIITEEGQEVAGQTGLNIPVLKKLYSKDTNGGVEPAWRKVENLGNMSHDAWVAGGELRQDTFNIFKVEKRAAFRNEVRTFFVNMQKAGYNAKNGTIEELIDSTVKSYNLQKPSGNLR